MKKLFTTHLGQNILANYLAVVWTGVLSVGLIPLYLKMLGTEQWAIVAVCMTIQAFLGLLDAGLGQIMPRDMAQAAGNRLQQEKYFLVFSRIYLVLAVTGFMLGQASAHWVVRFWIHPDGISITQIEWALRLIFIQFLFQFANNAHIGYWNGLEKQKTANIRQCVFATAKYLSAFILISNWQQNALAYLLPFAVFSFIEWLSNRISVLKGLSFEGRHQKISSSDLLFFAKQSMSLATAVLIGMLLSQLDRIVLSRTVPLVDYGIYVIVANLGLAFMQLQAPLMRAFQPRIAQDALKSREVGKGGKFMGSAMLKTVLIICVLPCLLTAVFAPEVLGFWTRNAEVVEKGTAALRCITMAVAINAIYGIMYLRIVALNANRFLLLVNLTILGGYFLAVEYFGSAYGIVAGGMGWLFYTSCQLVAGLVFVLRLSHNSVKQADSERAGSPYA